MEETSQDRFTRHLVEARARQVAEDTPPLLRQLNDALTARAEKAEATVNETWKLVDAFRHKLEASEQSTGMQAVQIADLTKRNELLAESDRQTAREIAALTTRAEKAEARVKEQQAELAEQEAGKLALIRQLFPANKARAKARAILTGADQSPANAALIQPAP